MSLSERIYYSLLHPLRKLYWFLRHPKSLRVKCLAEYKGHFLFVRNRYLKYWTLPGGFVRRRNYRETLIDESPTDAARRVLNRELGLTIKTIVPLWEYHVTTLHREDTIECFLAQVESAETKVRRRDLWEASWYKAEQPPFPLGFTAREILRLYFKKEKAV